MVQIVQGIWSYSSGGGESQLDPRSGDISKPAGGEIAATEVHTKVRSRSRC